MYKSGHPALQAEAPLSQPPRRRYSARPLPAYRHRPGRTPHPRLDPRGHAHGLPEPAPRPVDPGAWREAETYLFAIDLFNAGYFWECHEALEGPWRAAGRGSVQGRFLQGLILLAASELKRETGRAQAAGRLAARARARWEGLPSPYMGLDVAALAAALRARGSDRAPPLRIALAQP